MSSLSLENAAAPSDAPAAAAAKPAQPVVVQRRGSHWTSPEMLLMGALLTLAFVGLYFRWFRTQHLMSAEAMQDWGHAYIIPLISGYMIWLKRAELARIQPSVFWPGLPPMMLGIVSYFFFVGTRFTGGHMIQGWAMLLTLFGVCLLVLGPRVMRRIFLPISFLIVGITISEMVMIRLTFPLQLIASQGSHALLTIIGTLAGFGTEVAGNQITLYTASGIPVPLNIAEACSGMRMVIAFFALGAALALLTLPQWWQRIALMLLAFPVAILLNVARVSVLGLVSLADPQLASGEAHTFIGTLLLIPGLFLFLGIGWALKRAVAPPRPTAKPKGAAA